MLLRRLAVVMLLLACALFGCAPRSTQLASRPAANMPPDLACRRDGDCVFAYPGPCGACPAPPDCRTQWRTATNRQAYEREDRRYPKANGVYIGDCQPCLASERCPGAGWLGSRAVCNHGRCEVR